MDAHRASAVTPRRAAVLVAALALALSACSSGDSEGDGGSTGAADGPTVDTALLTFYPKDVTFKQGQTVTWVGGDNITHVLVQGAYEVGPDGLRTKETDDKTFNLKLTKKGQRVSHTYDTAGTFTYYCTIHHGMNGTVTVS